MNEPGAAITCNTVLDELAISGRVQVSSCSPVDPRSVDIRQSEREMRACDLTDGRQVEARFVRGDLLNPRVRVTRGSNLSHEFVLKPTTAVRSETFGAGPKLACDSVARFYVAHPWMGYVSAFTPDGDELWRRELSGFVGLDRMIESKEPPLSEVRKVLEASTSTVSQLMLSGEYLAVEFRTGGEGTYQVFYHRSGVEVGRLGPWDGRLLEASPVGWRLVAGGGWDLRFYVPTDVLDVSVSGDPLPSVISHALGWLQPRPMDKKLTYQCLGRLADEVQHWVGEDFNPHHAELARSALVAMGGEQWFEGLLESTAMVDIVADFDPLSSDWQEAYRRALVNAGVDIDVARAWEGSLEATRSAR